MPLRADFSIPQLPGIHFDFCRLLRIIYRVTPRIGRLELTIHSSSFGRLLAVISFGLDVFSCLCSTAHALWTIAEKAALAFQSGLF